jgi:DNA-binding PadR family transcriptional regulator
MPAATAERARALRLLARCPNGCAEALILAQGFTVPFLADLVSDRLVTAELNTPHDVWVQITDLGREALAQQAAT